MLRRVSGADVRVTALETAAAGPTTRAWPTLPPGPGVPGRRRGPRPPAVRRPGAEHRAADAANLGWKLAAVVRGDAGRPARHLHAERHRWPGLLANTRAQARLPRPSRSPTRCATCSATHPYDDVKRLIGEMMSGLSGRYDFGSEEDLVGRLVGDRPSAARASLYELMRDGWVCCWTLPQAARLHGWRLPPHRPYAASPSPAGHRCCSAPTPAWPGPPRSRHHRLAEALRRWFPAAAPLPIGP